MPCPAQLPPSNQTTFPCTDSCHWHASGSDCTVLWQQGRHVTSSSSKKRHITSCSKLELSLLLQAQQSELQSLLRLTQSTEEGQGQGQEQRPASFRALVLNRAIPQALAGYTLGLFTFLPQEPPPGAPSSEQVPQKEDRSKASDTSTAGTVGKIGIAEEMCKRGSEQWKVATEQAGLPWALQLLAAFARQHQVCCRQLLSACELECRNELQLLQQRPAHVAVMPYQ